MSDHALSLRLIPEPEETRSHEALVESYRRLADVFHDVLGEQSLDALLDRIADALADLIPHDSLTIYEADEPRRILIPVWARDKWADKILADRCPFVLDRCRAEAPPLAPVGEQHRAACWRAPLEADVLVPDAPQAVPA